MSTKKIAVRFIKSPMAMGLAYHPPQEAELVESLAKEVVNNGFAEFIEEPVKTQKKKVSAPERIKAIEAAESVEAVQALLDGEAAKTVLASAEKRIAELKDADNS